MPTSAPVFDALESTSAAVAAIADSLPDWSISTPAEGWTVAHQVAHLAWTDEVSLVSATDPDGFAAILTDAMQDPMGFVDAGAAELAQGKLAGRPFAVVRGRSDLVLPVDDDGPGLPPEERAQALKRGQRLDENAPGSGLGLSIVDELARAYGGSVQLGESPMGGLRVALDLPRAEA